MSRHDSENEKARDDQLTDLLKVDYDNTSRFIDSILSTIGTQRGWLITLWLAVMGVAVDKESWPLPLLAIAVVLVFALLDAFHSSLYRDAFHHARRIEAIWARWYERLGAGATDPDIDLSARAELQAHRFGLFEKLDTFDLRTATERPSGAFTWVYAFLATASVIAAAVYGC